MRQLFLLLYLCLNLHGCTQTATTEDKPLFEQTINSNYEVALADLDSVFKNEDISLDEFTQMVVALIDPEDLSTSKMTYRELWEQAKETAQHAKGGKEAVESGIRISNQSLAFISQNEDSVEFDLVFRVDNLMEEDIYDLELMVATYRPDGTDDYGSTGGSGYLEGKVLEAGTTSGDLHFPIVIFFSEEDDPEGEYGSYAIVRNLKAGGIGAVELTPFDLRIGSGWMVMPR